MAVKGSAPGNGVLRNGLSLLLLLLLSSLLVVGSSLGGSSCRSVRKAATLAAGAGRTCRDVRVQQGHRKLVAFSTRPPKP